MVRIQFQSIHIDNLENSSSVNKGTNRIVGKRDFSKNNQGLGAVHGERNVIIGGKHAVDDGDHFDYKPFIRKS
ncbi:hypothetical protein [Paenibacillus planticolens]|uniref:Spore germination protein GerPA/GerPF n=1 Tax=Paenibacillus planticolens TaxID=2654976 RepID=A0ABX1ZNH2_9BACL|nr:hypothetical protein [Paenibacillus planticolens]NOV00165.1 hypothetical protein [Paenibacillus planticolens]